MYIQNTYIQNTYMYEHCQRIHTLPKVYNAKIKRNARQLFSSSRLSSFLALISLYFSLLHGLEAAFRSYEIKVHIGDLVQITNHLTVNPVNIYMHIKHMYSATTCN